jgi:subtilisin family serine protease
VIVGGLVAALALLATTGAPAAGQSAELDRYIVNVTPGAGIEQGVQGEVRRLGGRFVEPLEFVPNTFVIAINARGADALASRPGVVYVERDQLMHLVHHQCGHNHPRFGPGACATGTLTGTVGAAEGGGALEGVLVAVSGGGGSATTGSDGGYTIANVPVGTHSVTASKVGYESQTKSASISENVAAVLNLELTAVTGDPGTGDSSQVTTWGISKIQAPAAWNIATGNGAGVCVADTGIDKSHEDLAYVAGMNFTGGGPFSNPQNSSYGDGNGHGTHVAGTIAALDNSVGVIGVAPDAHLYVAKVLDDNGSGWISQIVNGLRWCADQPGVHVINMSFGGGDSTTLSDAIKYAANAGVVLIAASGNSGASQPGFPARYDEVIAVGAANDSDQIASFSNRGEEVNAPGVGVLSTVPGGYATYSGTSMASPHAAGVAALIISAGESDPVKVRTSISGTADAIAGGIRVNACRIVEATCPTVAARHQPGGATVVRTA